MFGRFVYDRRRHGDRRQAWGGGAPQPTVTEEVVLRGRFQTLPVAIYGWALSTHPADVSPFTSCCSP